MLARRWPRERRSTPAATQGAPAPPEVAAPRSPRRAPGRGVPAPRKPLLLPDLYDMIKCKSEREYYTLNGCLQIVCACTH